jgi:hypothetical protein
MLVLATARAHFGAVVTSKNIAAFDLADSESSHMYG